MALVPFSGLEWARDFHVESFLCRAMTVNWSVVCGNYGHGCAVLTMMMMAEKVLIQRFSGKYLGNPPVNKE